MTNGEKATIREVYNLHIETNSKLDTLIANFEMFSKACDKRQCTNDKRFEKSENGIKEVKDNMSNIKIKIWGLAGLIGAIMGFIGVIVGKFI